VSNAPRTARLIASMKPSVAVYRGTSCRCGKTIDCSQIAPKSPEHGWPLSPPVRPKSHIGRRRRPTLRCVISILRTRYALAPALWLYYRSAARLPAHIPPCRSQRQRPVRRAPHRGTKTSRWTTRTRAKGEIRGRPRSRRNQNTTTRLRGSRRRLLRSPRPLREAPALAR